MMDVCRKGQTEVKESKGTFDIPREQIALLFKNPGSKSSVENRNCKFEIAIVNKIPNCSLREHRNIEQKADEHSDKFDILCKAHSLYIWTFIYFHRYFRSKPKIRSIFI